MQNKEMTLHDLKAYLGDYTHFENETTAHWLNEWYHEFPHLEANLSYDMSQLIMEAARCNRFASDILIWIDAFNRDIGNFDENNYQDIYVFGFTKNGVDGGTEVLSRINWEPSKIYREYFAVYFIEIIKDDEYPHFYKIRTTGYHV